MVKKMDYYRIKMTSELYNEIVGLLKSRIENSDNFLEIKADMDRISYLKFEKEKYVNKKREQDYMAEIEQSTIDGFIRYLIQVKRIPASNVVGTIREYYDYISDLNSSYFTPKKTADVMERINEVAYDDEIDEMPILPIGDFPKGDEV